MRYGAQLDWLNFLPGRRARRARPLRRGLPADPGALGSGDPRRGADRERPDRHRAARPDRRADRRHALQARPARRRRRRPDGQRAGDRLGADVAGRARGGHRHGRARRGVRADRGGHHPRPGRAKSLAERLGRNAACDRAGNIFIGGLAGLVGWAFGQRAVFHLVPLFAVLTASPCWRSRPARSITSRRAASTRTAPAVAGGPPDGACCSSAGRSWCSLRRRSVPLRQRADAAAVDQKLALAHPGAETVLVAACVVTAQLVSVPTALLVGARADTWGRKPLLLAAFAALPLRGVLYTVSDDPAFLIAVQALDGIAPRHSRRADRVGAGRYHARDRPLQRGPRVSWAPFRASAAR